MSPAALGRPKCHQIKGLRSSPATSFRTADKIFDFARSKHPGNLVLHGRVQVSYISVETNNINIASRNAIQYAREGIDRCIRY